MANQYDLFLTKLFNITEKELNELIYEEKDGKTDLKSNAGELLIEKAASIEKARKDRETKLFEDGHKKGTSELDKKARNLIKDKFGFDKDGLEKLEEFIDEFSGHFNSKIEEAKKGSKGQLTDDDVKKHPLFIDVEKKLLKLPEELAKQFEEEKKGIISKYERDQNIRKIKDKAKALLLQSGAVLPQNQKVADNQINLFLSTLNEYDYDLTDENEPIILKGEKRLEDKLGHPLKFNELITNTIQDYFEIQKQENRENANNQNNNQNNNTQTYNWREHSEYVAAYAKEPDRDKRAIMRESAKKLWPDKVA